MSAKALILALTLLLLAFGCSAPMTAERLEKLAGRKLNNLGGYYAELTATVYSMEAEQTYLIKEWFQAPDLWRVEIAGSLGRQVFICDGQHIYIYEPGFDDFYRFSIDQAPLLAPPFLLSGYLEQFISAAGGSFLGEDARHGAPLYKVTYATETSGDLVTLWLDKKDFFPRRIETYSHGELLSLVQTVYLDLKPRFDKDYFRFEAAGNEVAYHCLIKLFPLEKMEELPYPIYLPQYLPDGCFLYLVSRGADNGREKLTVIYKGSRRFSLVQRPMADTSPFVGKFTKAVMIGRNKGYYQKNITTDIITLWWSKENTDFVLSGSLSLREAVKIAASLQPPRHLSISGAYDTTERE